MLKGRIIKRLVFLVATVLIATLSPHSASARDLVIWDKLQGTNPKGYVLLMRHALAPGIGDPDNFLLGDCRTQRNLSDEGRADAQDIGQWLERREVKIYRIETSRWCRAKETAELLNIGPVKLNKNLDSLFLESNLSSNKQTINIEKRIAKHRNKRGLLILVGHSVNMSALTGISLESGEGVLVRTDSQGALKIMGFSPTP
jgi:phosphohistidine phosphatase SixA